MLVSINVMTVIFITVAIFIGVFAPNFKIGILTSFMYFFINIYSIFQIIFHFPSSETYIVSKPDPDFKVKTPVDVVK